MPRLIQTTRGPRARSVYERLGFAPEISPVREVPVSAALWYDCIS